MKIFFFKSLVLQRNKNYLCSPVFEANKLIASCIFGAKVEDGNKKGSFR
jgi:hypothetical protein